MKVWVLQTGEPIPFVDSASRSMRAANVTDALISAGHEVTLWTADFSHQTLAHRYGRNTVLRPSENLDIRLLHSRGYRRNIGLGRMIDHAEIARRLRRMLVNERPPDVAFVGFPPIEIAWVMTEWLTRHNVPALIDVKDQWPDVLLRPVPTPLTPVGKLALTPYAWMAKQALTSAEGISSITPEFLQWALQVAGREESDSDCVLPLTCRVSKPDPKAEAAAASWWDLQGVPDDGRFRAIYVGSLNSAVSIEAILAAAASTDGQFVVCGDGPLANSFRAAAEHHPNVVMPGWIDQTQYSVLASRASVALAPYVSERGFALGIPNKVYDAMASGLPIVTSNSGALERLIAEEGIGSAFVEGGVGQFASGLARLAKQPEEVQAMSARIRCVYDESYSFEKVYGALVDHLEGMARDASARSESLASDMALERERYDQAAEREMSGGELLRGVDGSPRQFQRPYLRFWDHIEAVVGYDDIVLDLGAGTGRHTEVLAASSESVLALDVSEKSLTACVQRSGGGVRPICGDMANIPLVDKSVDVVATAGSLSYGEPNDVDAEIFRVLKPGGTLIVVDSLNHNPVYRVNRWLHSRRGNRTRSTLERMPDLDRIRSLSRDFDSVRIEYYGTFLFAYPLVSRLLGSDRALEIFDGLDKKSRQGRMAFKFVLLAEGFQPPEVRD